MTARLYRVRLAEMSGDFTKAYVREFYVGAATRQKAIAMAKQSAYVSRRAAVAVEVWCIKGGIYRTKATTLNATP